MAAIHNVLRYLLARVPHSTQDEHDRIAAMIDQDDDSVETPQDDDGAQTTPAEQDEGEAKKTTPAHRTGGRKS